MVNFFLSGTVSRWPSTKRMRNVRRVATGDPPFLINSSTIKDRCSPDHAIVYTENGTYTAVRRHAPHPMLCPLPNQGVLSAAPCTSCIRLNNGANQQRQSQSNTYFNSITSSIKCFISYEEIQIFNTFRQSTYCLIANFCSLFNGNCWRNNKLRLLVCCKSKLRVSDTKI